MVKGESWDFHRHAYKGGCFSLVIFKPRENCPTAQAP